MPTNDIFAKINVSFLIGKLLTKYYGGDKDV